MDGSIDGWIDPSMDGVRVRRATCVASSVVDWRARWCAVYMPGGGGGTASTTTHTTTTRESTATATDSRAPSTEDGARVVTTDGTTTTSSGRIRASRARCHAARDAYVAACARTEPTNDASGSGGAAVTTTTTAAAAAAAACVTLRAAYDAACPRSWVDHFDARRAEDAKVRRVLASREGGA